MIPTTKPLNDLYKVWQKEKIDNGEKPKMKDFALLCGVRHQTMSRYLSGKLIPGTAVCKRIALALNCNIGDIVDFERVE